MRGLRRREEYSPIEIIGGRLRVWRDQHTGEIIIEPPVVTPATKCGGLVCLSARDARHLASSLLLFAAETESRPAVTAETSPISVALDVEGDQST